MMSRMAIQKFGSDSPRTPTIWTSVRTRTLRETLAATPSGIAHEGDAQDREQGELDRDRQPRHDEGRDRLAGAERPAEVPPEHVPDPPEVLDGQRLVEAELLQHGRALRAAELALRPRDDVDDVAGKEADQEEDQDRDAEDGENGPDRTAGEVAHPRAAVSGQRAASRGGRSPLPAVGAYASQAFLRKSRRPVNDWE